MIMELKSFPFQMTETEEGAQYINLSLSFLSLFVSSFLLLTKQIILYYYYYYYYYWSVDTHETQPVHTPHDTVQVESSFLY